jgi:hypothetical protein
LVVRRIATFTASECKREGLEIVLASTAGTVGVSFVLLACFGNGDVGVRNVEIIRNIRSVGLKTTKIANLRRRRHGRLETSGMAKRASMEKEEGNGSYLHGG